MRGSTVLWAVGGAIVVGTLIYGLYQYRRNQEETICQEPVDSITPDVIYEDTSRSVDIISEFEQTQQNTLDSIREHHREAAQQLEITLSEMVEDTAIFEETTKQINDDLDALLK